MFAQNVVSTYEATICNNSNDKAMDRLFIVAETSCFKNYLFVNVGSCNNLK